MNDWKKVMVTFYSMKYPNTGFYFYGKGLSSALMANKPESLDFTFYIDKSVPQSLFPSGLKFINKSLLHKLLFPHQFDVVHFSDQYCRPHPSLVKKGKKILSIHDINPYYDRKDKPAKLKRYVARMKGFIKNCDRVVAISEFVSQEVCRVFPEAKNKIRVIYNGADKLVIPSNFNPNYKSHQPFLFTLGMLSPKKNFHVLTCLLKDNMLRLVIAGIVKEEYKSRILEEARKYGCEDRVDIIGTISDDEKAWYYQNCYAFMFPSLAEGFGLPVIEAMHFGNPVFLSSLTSLPEIGGDAAFYFKNFDPEHMIDVFKAGMHQYEETPDFVNKLKKRSDLFTWNNTAQAYLKLYQELLQS